MASTKRYGIISIFRISSAENKIPTFRSSIAIFCRKEYAQAVQNISIHTRLKEIRLSKHLTQAELAQMSNIGRATIGDIENETHLPRVDIAIRLARTLGTTVEDIFDVK